MFDAGVLDGFYNQMYYIANGATFSTSPLYLVHLLRFIVVSPFYYCYINGVNVFFETVLLLMFLLPVVTASFKGRQFYAQILFLYLPIFFSYRSVLVMCAMAYLFICLYGDKKSYLLLIFSALLANLSSGVVVPWVLIAFMNIKELSNDYRFVRVIAALVIIVLGFSIFQKIGFFFYESGGSGGFWERNTFWVSIKNEQYFRFLFYFLLVSIWFWITLCKIYFASFSMKMYSFYLPMIVTFFFEGLGLVSFIIPIFWFFVGIKHFSHTRLFE
jgi:hypothetical protein